MGVDGSAGVSVMGPIMPAPPVDAETPTRRASPGAGGTPVTLTPVRAETEIPETIPENFRLAVRSMHEAPVRSGITVTEIRPPRKLAPLSHAVGLEVDRGLSEDELLAAADQAARPTGVTPGRSVPAPTDGDAFGRLSLLHDPRTEEHSGGAMRLVAYVQADMDDAVASDPLLPDVAWDWLTEGLAAGDADVTDLGGTVTSTASVRYGSIGGPPRAHQLEMRASWTAGQPDLSAHVRAFSEVLANVAGLPPEGVAVLGRN